MLFQIWDNVDRQETDKTQLMTKNKVIRNLWTLNGNFILKMVIRKVGPRNFFRLPKLGAKSLHANPIRMSPFDPSVTHKNSQRKHGRTVKPRDVVRINFGASVEY